MSKRVAVIQREDIERLLKVWLEHDPAVEDVQGLVDHLYGNLATIEQARAMKGDCTPREERHEA